MRLRLYALAVAALWAGVVIADPVTKSIPAPPAAVKKSQPETLEELKTFQKHFHSVVDKVLPCTVCLQLGNGSGSGVIVSKDGLIMTAGHVSGEPGKKVRIILSDGKKVDGETLGVNPFADSGMVKITTKGEYPYTEIAPSKDLKQGQWVLTTGHPGGWKQDRPPVVRVGRIGKTSFKPDGGAAFVQSDCSLVGGDSGGPLFDMEGRVVGIHSRIGDQLMTENYHVPSDQFRDEWEKLVSGDVLGGSPHLGVVMADGAKDCKLGEVRRGTPAARAGLKVGDIITKFAGKEVASYEEMVKVLQTQKPLSEVTVEVKRGEETKQMKVKIGYRPNS